MSLPLLGNYTSAIVVSTRPKLAALLRRLGLGVAVMLGVVAALGVVAVLPPSPGQPPGPPRPRPHRPGVPLVRRSEAAGSLPGAPSSAPDFLAAEAGPFSAMP